MSSSKLHVNIEQNLARLLGPITAVLKSEQLNISPATVLKSYKGGVELLHLSHFHHVSLVQRTNCLLPATGDIGMPRVQPHIGTGITCGRRLATVVILT